jgi:hypothetical protein
MQYDADVSDANYTHCSHRYLPLSLFHCNPCMFLNLLTATIFSNLILLDADLGYFGIERYHPNSFIPVKSSKNHQLTKEKKAYNKILARRRVGIEHINAKIKTFKSMAYPYRGHYCNRHSLRMTLICGIINYDRNI